MIKIMKYSEVSKDEIFARTEPTANVSDIVSDIIAAVVFHLSAAGIVFGMELFYISADKH